MKSLFAKCVVVLLVAVTFNLPAQATCNKVVCNFGPSIPCDQLLYDNYFQNWTCAWFKSNVTIVSSPSAYAQFTGSSSAWLHQEILVPTGYSTHEIAVLLDNTVSGSSTARLHVEIRDSSGNLLETLGIIEPGDPDDLYRFNPSNYGGNYIRVRFSYVPGASPGSADFKVQYADYFVS